MKYASWILAACLFLFFSHCKSGKHKIAEGEKIEIADFVGLFEDAKLPLQLTDSLFQQKMMDTIHYGVFTQFVPDSTFSGVFHKSKPLFFPIGKVQVKNAETYLFVKATSASKKAAYLLVLDKDNKFVSSLPLLVADNDKTTSSVASMDSRYTITLLAQQSRSNQQAEYKKDVYVYNSAGVFTLILTESNGAPAKPEDVVNPIDTFSAKHKLAGDYLQNKRNIISFRDGIKAAHLMFFVHFEKDNGECKGELKGEAKIISDKLVRFSEPGSPCVIDFSFAGKNVTMKEVGGCGSYRDIKCFFEGSFTKKSVVKKAKDKK